MKILSLILTSSFLFGCANQTTADKIENDTARTSPTVAPANQISNANSVPAVEYESKKVDEAKRKELDAQNERSKQIPDEFRAVDFKNFKYPYARLKDGEYEEKDEYLGGTRYFLIMFFS